MKNSHILDELLNVVKFLYNWIENLSLGGGGMKNKLMFFILSVFLGVTTVFCQYSNSFQTYDVFVYSKYPVGSIWGDPLPDAPALALRGKYLVGVQTLELINPGQIDILRTIAENSVVVYDRPLKVEIWYPAILEPGQVQLTLYSDFLGRADKPGTLRPYTFLGRATLNALPNTQDAPYPLVIISHGYPGSRYLLAYLGENLASKGYVVVSIDHTDSTYKDVSGSSSFVSTVVNRTIDQKFVIREILKMPVWKDMCNPDAVGIIGYSMGAFGALMTLGAGLDNNEIVNRYFGVFASKLFAKPSDEGDPLMKACVLFAPWGGAVGSDPTGVWNKDSLAKINVPTLWIAGSEDDVAGYRGIVNLFNSAVNSKRYLLTYLNALHNVAPHPAPAEAVEFDDYYRFADPVWDVWKINNINEHFVTAFFDFYLKGDETAREYLNVTAGNWPGFKPRTKVGMEFRFVDPEKAP